MLNKMIPLSEADVRKAKPKATEYTLSAGDGQFLVVKPSGHKFWYQYYYYNGNRKAQDLGSYPLASLRMARSAIESKLHICVYSGINSPFGEITERENPTGLSPWQTPKKLKHETGIGRRTRYQVRTRYTKPAKTWGHLF